MQQKNTEEEKKTLTTKWRTSGLQPTILNWSFEWFIHHSASSLFRSREWPGRWTSSRRGGFFCLEKQVMKVRQLRVVKCLVLEIEVRHLHHHHHHHQLENSNHSNWSYVLTGSCHNSCYVLLKTSEKKMYQKATAKVSANPTHQNGSALWNEVGNGFEATQKKNNHLNSFRRFQQV